LNELDYPWQVGFSRFVLSARDPNIRELPEDALAELQATLGCQLRLVWAHY
jgi:hypothetical protein